MSYSRRNSNFSLGIQNPSTQELFTVDDQGYVEIQEEQLFWLYLHNENPYACSATVSMNDDEMGVFIIEPYQTLQLKNPDPQFATGQFQTLKQGSEGWAAAQMDKVSKDSRGVVSVVFQPGTVIKNRLLDSYTSTAQWGSNDNWTSRGAVSKSFDLNKPQVTFNSSVSSTTHEEVGIGLSGENVQDFKKVKFVDLKLDPTTIEVRFIAPKSPQIKPTAQRQYQTNRPRSLS